MLWHKSFLHVCHGYRSTDSRNPGGTFDFPVFLILIICATVAAFNQKLWISEEQHRFDLFRLICFSWSRKSALPRMKYEGFLDMYHLDSQKTFGAQGKCDHQPTPANWLTAGSDDHRQQVKAMGLRAITDDMDEDATKTRHRLQGHQWRYRENQKSLRGFVSLWICNHGRYGGKICARA